MKSHIKIDTSGGGTVKDIEFSGCVFTGDAQLLDVVAGEGTIEDVRFIDSLVAREKIRPEHVELARAIHRDVSKGMDREGVLAKYSKRALEVGANLATILQAIFKP